MDKQKQIDLMAEMYNDIMYFALVVLPHHFYLTPADFHREIAKQLGKEKPDKYTCIVAPRGFAKSSLVSLAYILHQVLYRKARFVILLSDTATQAERFLDTIKAELESNETIRALWGNLEGKKWTSSEIELAIGVRILAQGSGGKIRGIKYNQYRPDLIVVDDLENDELVKNKERRQDLELWYEGAVIPTLDPNGRLVIIGTILHYDSLLSKLSHDPQYTQMFYQAIMNGRSLWEERMSLEAILQLKESYKKRGLLDVFQCEYMNEPISDENAVFRKEWFKYFGDNDVDYRFLNKVIAVDLAIGMKSKNDYSVVMVCGMNDRNEIYVLEYSKGRYTPIEVIKEIFRLARKWGVPTVGIEAVAYQKSLSYFVQEEMRRSGQFFMIEDLKPDTDKERRIRGLQPRYATGTMYHRPNQTDLEEELLLFPKSPHDDLSDTLYYCASMLKAGRKTSMPFNPDYGRGIKPVKQNTLANF